MEQRPTSVTPLVHSIQTLQKEIGSQRAQESREITIGLFFHMLGCMMTFISYVFVTFIYTSVIVFNSKALKYYKFSYSEVLTYIEGG
jgi:hypothetical protein